MHTFPQVFVKRTDRMLGRFLSLLQPAGFKTMPNTAPQSIAAIRLAAIGESLLALPALAALKRHWPKSEITVITTPRLIPVFAGQIYVDRIENVWRGLWKKFDITVDFEPYLYASAVLARTLGKYSIGFDTLSRSRLYTKSVPYRDDQHVVKTNFDLVRALGVQKDIPKSLLPVHSPSPRLRRAARAIALAPGGRVDFRRWPAERFAEVADYLIENYQCQIAVVGNKADEPILKNVQLKMKNSAQIISRLSFPEVAQLLTQCRLTIANDGGLMHISAAMGTPTLGLFGPETPVRLGPYGPKNRALYHQLDDNPIINVSRGEVPGMMKVRTDPTRYVRAITVDEVAVAADEMLREGEATILVTASKTSFTEMARIS